MNSSDTNSRTVDNIEVALKQKSFDHYDDSSASNLMQTKKYSAFNPTGYIFRYSFLFFLCFLNFSNYFCYDNPSALENTIERTLSVNDERYGVLYSVYSWPNIVLTFFGGYLIDRVLGIRWGAISFALFVAGGQLVFALGGYFGKFWLMIVGRFIFAIGGGNLSVAQNTYTAKWYKGKEFNAVFGIQLSSARAGSTANQFSMLPIYTAIAALYGQQFSDQALGLTLLFAFGLCALSALSGFVLLWYDKKRDRYLETEQQNQDVKTPAKRKISPKAILQFPLTFWLICWVCVTFYIAIMPFVSFGQMFYVNKFKLSPYEGATCNGIVYFVAIPATIASGFIVHVFGRNVTFCIISIALGILGHCLLAFTFITPYAGTIILGCAYSLLAASLWPCVAYVVEQHAWATAYGLMQAIQNLGLALALLLVGFVVDETGYLVLEIFFILVLCICLGLSIFMYFADYARGGYLIMGVKSRKEFDKSE